MRSDQAYLAEIFDSIQGEGLLVGSRQVFLRFCGCNLSCSYCDTPAGLEKGAACAVRYRPVLPGPPELLVNPISMDKIKAILPRFSPRWISLTGGEPLLWEEFIMQLAPYLKQNHRKILLETNGTLYEPMARCGDCIDLVSMDYKLPSSTGVNLKEQHAKFLTAAFKSRVYIKMVVTAQSNWNEIQEAIDVIRSVSADLILYLQPVTPSNGVEAVNLDFLLAIQKYCQDYIPETRILPQIHRCLNWI